MPDSDKPLGQAVQQEPSDELHRADGDTDSVRFFFRSLALKVTMPSVKRLDTAVCNSHPVRVACQVLKDMFGLIDRIAHTDHPFFCKKRVLEFSIRISDKPEFVTLAGQA